jgi:hypothetical protein
MNNSETANSFVHQFSLQELVRASKVVNELPALIYFDKYINLDSQIITSNSSVNIQININKRFNLLGNCLLSESLTIEPGKRIIKIENHVFINAQLVLTKQDGSKYILTNKKGFLELKGKVI